MKRGLVRALFFALVTSLISAPVFGQGSTTSTISGVVVDKGGGVVPGATVVVKNNASGSKFNVVTNSAGAFSVPALDAGVYTVTVSLSGFKTAVINDVRVAVGTPVSVKATLELGNVEETIEVRAASSELINTQTPTIASTMNADQINKLPMPSRNAVNAVTFLPGVNTATTNRNSTFNGLPNSFVAISLDGVNNNENYNKSTEGLFAMVTPRQDAVEAVTVTTATGGADVGGHGAVQIAFVTRSGSNRFAGSGYHYHRDPGLNSNYWFNTNNNLPKNDVVLNQYGARQGGPIIIPGVYDGRGKAFFFGNYEELRLPNNFTRTRIVLSPEAQAGLFSWSITGGQTRSVNVLQMAANAGYLSSLDPLTNKVLNEIRKATQAGGTLNVRSEPNTLDYVWQSPGNQYEKQSVFRVDYNLSAKHRVTGVYNWQVVVRDPDQLNGGDSRFPGFPNTSTYVSHRPLTSATLRSTLTSNLVNEIKGGLKWGPSQFGEHPDNIQQTFGPLGSLQGSGGYALTLGGFGTGNNLTNWHTENGPTARSAWSWNIDDTLNWQRGKHSLSFGGSLFFGNVWADNRQLAPAITFGVASSDPANAMFTTANFQGASSAQLDNARTLFALLTGRVTNFSSQVVLDQATNQYSFLGTRRRAGVMNEYSMFAQDSWRLSPTLTVNAGLRWDIQMPWQPKNDILTTATLADACGISGFRPDGECRFFEAGATGGKTPEFVLLGKGANGWNVDWNNVAPNVGVAWRPNVQNGWLRSVLGDPEQATIRAGYSEAYAREGMAVFVGQYGSNPGSQITVSRSETNGLLVPPGDPVGWPFLLRDQSRFTLPAQTPSFPLRIRSARQDSINFFHPDIKVAYARTYTVSFQRSLSREMAVDIRYVGTRGVNQWTNENWNSSNINLNFVDNGFLDEFKAAQANLQANLAAGRGGTFAYFGPGTGTSPLPIYLGYFNGSKDTSNPSAYSGANWTNTTFVGRLARTNPDPRNAANDLDGNQTRRTSAATAGLAANLFVVNPDASSVNVYTSDAFSSYDALQIEVRRRLSRGLQINGSYQYAFEYGSQNLGKRYGRVSSPSPTVRHAIKMQWDYSVPVGRGRRFGTEMNPVLEAILGGWEFDGAGRVQARVVDFGNVRLVGLTLEDLSREYAYRINPDPNNPGRQIVTVLPDDIILNTRRAFNTSATSSTGYSDLGVPQGRYLAPPNSETCIQFKAGDCASRTTLVRVPFFTRFDVGLTKKFLPRNKVNFELRFDVLNVFNAIDFNPYIAGDNLPLTGATIFQVTSAYTDASNTFDPGGRLGQIVWRINW